MPMSLSGNSNFFQNQGLLKNYRRYIVDIGVSQARLPSRIIFWA